jgi:uncharacterized membrane protein
MSLNMSIIMLGLFFYLVTCLLILDIAKKDFGAIHIQILWVFITLIPFIGCVLYLVFGYRKGNKPDKNIPCK